MGQETSKPKLTCRLSEVSYLDIEELVAIYRGKGNMEQIAKNWVQ